MSRLSSQPGYSSQTSDLTSTTFSKVLPSSRLSSPAEVALPLWQEEKAEHCLLKMLSWSHSKPECSTASRQDFGISIASGGPSSRPASSSPQAASRTTSAMHREGPTHRLYITQPGGVLSVPSQRVTRHGGGAGVGSGSG